MNHPGCPKWACASLCQSSFSWHRIHRHLQSLAPPKCQLPPAASSPSRSSPRPGWVGGKALEAHPDLPSSASAKAQPWPQHHTSGPRNPHGTEGALMPLPSSLQTPTSVPSCTPPAQHLLATVGHPHWAQPCGASPGAQTLLAPTKAHPGEDLQPAPAPARSQDVPEWSHTPGWGWLLLPPGRAPGPEPLCPPRRGLLQPSPGHTLRASSAGQRGQLQPGLLPGSLRMLLEKLSKLKVGGQRQEKAAVPERREARRGWNQSRKQSQGLQERLQGTQGVPLLTAQPAPRGHCPRHPQGGAGAPGRWC